MTTKESDGLKIRSSQYRMDGNKGFQQSNSLLETHSKRVIATHLITGATLRMRTKEVEALGLTTRIIAA
jgi:hypothetical protein